MIEKNKKTFEKYKKKVSDSDINKSFYDRYLEIMADNMAFNKFCKLVPKFYQMYAYIFADKHLKDLTSEYLYERLKSSDKGDQRIYFAFRFIFFLIDSNVELDESILALTEFRDYILDTNFHSVLLDFLKNPDKKKYCIDVYRGKKQLLFIDVDDTDLLTVIKEYTANYKISGDSSRYKFFLENFSKSCPYSPTLNNLNFDVYKHQVEYFKPYKKDQALSILNNLYYFIGIYYRPDIFADKNLQPMNFQLNGFTCLIADGYEPINYNPIEDVPKTDKWLLIHNNKNVSNCNISKSGSMTLDFCKIKNDTYRQWAKLYIWEKVDINNANHILCYISSFCNYVTELKTGRILSIYTKPTKEIQISVDEIMAYKDFIYNKDLSGHTKNNYLEHCKFFVLYLTRNNIIPASPSIDYVLSNIIAPVRENKAKAIPNKELNMLAALLKEKAEINYLYELYSLVFFIALATEFRSSQILTLTTDCVKEASKPNEYVIISKSKTSAGEIVEQPITIYVKRHIDKIIELTQQYRDNCTIPELRKYLFLVPESTKKTKYQIITSNAFNRYFQKCCDELGLKHYNLSNLRDTYMTKADEFKLRNKLTDIQQNVITGHKSPSVDQRHYVDTNIRDLLESVHGIIIGDIDINGQIISSNAESIKPENEVSNGCGYCGRSTCNEFTMLDCMMCKSFVTTPDRLPYFQEQVKILNHKIENTTIPHDKEDLVNIKRLYLEFINKLLKIKGGAIDEQ